MTASDKEMRNASVVYRLGEMIAEGEKAGGRLEMLLREVLGLPEMKEAISDLLNRLEKNDAPVWEKAVQEFLTEAVEEYGLDASGGADVSVWSSEQRAEIYLHQIGWEGNLPQLATQVHTALCELFRKIIDNDLPEDFFEVLPEIGKVQKVRELVFRNIIGKIPADMAAAAAMFREKMLASPQLLVAMELMESNIGLAKPSPAFGPAWHKVKQRSLGRLKKKRLNLPGTRDYNGNRDTWSEESSLVQEVIFEELLHRISADPASILRDQLESKLANSLCLAVEHRTLDHIRYLRAKKRDVQQEVSMESEFTAEGRDGGDALSLENAIPSKDPGPAEQVERDDEYARLLAGLSAAEVEVIRQRYIEGLSVREVARLMKKSESWVTKTQAAAISKMRRRREGFGVAKKLPKTGKNQKGGQNNGEITHKR